MNEVAETIALIRDRVATPMIVDADNGYGNALNMQRTMRLFERAGAQCAADRGSILSQALRSPRRQDADLTGGYGGKLRCGGGCPAFGGNADHCPTDAIAVEGFSAAIDRAMLYAENGLMPCSSRRRAASRNWRRSPPHSRPAAADGEYGGRRQGRRCNPRMILRHLASRW